MENINIPSYSFLIPKDKIIKSIQDIYGFLSKASTEINALESSKQDALTFDTTPKSNSTNPVTSKGIYTAIDTVAGNLSTLDTTVQGLISRIEALEG